MAATEYQYSMSDVDSSELATWAGRMTEAMRKLPELADVDNNLANQGRALELSIDRDKASMLGVPMQTIDDTLYDAFGQRQISTIFTELNQYRVVLEVAPEFRSSTALMNQLAVASNGSGALTGTNATSFGQLTSSNSSTATGVGAQNTGIVVGAGSIIPLAALAEAKVTNTPLVVSHQQQLPAVTISFNLAPGHSLSQAVEAIEQARQDLEDPHPGACGVRRQGGRIHRQPDRYRMAAAGLDRGDLHRAGRALRELHPPADDHLHAAAGRRRRCWR